MSNRSWLRFRDQRARASSFTVPEAVRGCGSPPRRQAQPPATARRHGGGGRLPLGVAAPSPPPACRHIAHLPPAEVPLPDSFPRTKGAGVRPPPRGEAAPGGSPAGRRGRAKRSGAAPHRTAPGRSAAALVPAPRARLSGCGRRGEGSESRGAFPPEKSEVK